MPPTLRAPLYAEHGAVATPHVLASLAGLEALKEGGNALDAAIAANATLGVVWPHMNGLGGDLFLQMWWARDRAAVGLNASGRSSAQASAERLREQGHLHIPIAGGLAVSVPGVVDGWVTALERYGTRGLDRLLAPAVAYAEQGFPISAWLSKAIQDKLPALLASPAAARIYAPHGRAPRPGDRLTNPDLAATLHRVATQGRDGYYQGETASRIVRAVREAGGVLDEDDLAAQRSDWVRPLGTTYRGLELSELPPNTQGLSVLQMANLVEGFDLAEHGPYAAQTIHWMVEAKRAAFVVRDRELADPDAVTADLAWLTSKEWADRIRQLIQPERAALSFADVPSRRADGDTIYLCTADRDGNVVSLIQSLFHSFGSGVLADGTGVMLHNRGAGFTLEPGHPNYLAPRKRPFHTLIPALALRDGRPALVFGTRGADGQPQTQLQVLTNVVDFGLDPQAAVEAPRWVHGGPGAQHPADALVLEGRIPEVERLAEDLERRGHHVVISDWLDVGMGTAQLIQVDQERGIYLAGSDPRGDGVALGC